MKSQQLRLKIIHTYLTDYIEMNWMQLLPPKWAAFYQAGPLKDACNFLEKHGFKESDHMINGSTCMVAKYPNDCVLKLVTKKIPFFTYFPDKSVTDFKNIINQRFPQHFLPIIDILYEDQFYFIYTQKKIPILNLTDVNATNFGQILNVLQKMFTEQMITPDLISSNFGSYNDTLVLLDYHDLKPVKLYLAEQKWNKVVRCLMEFSSFMIHGESFEKKFGESYQSWKSEKEIVRRRYAADFFPVAITKIFESMATSELENIVNSLSACQEQLNKPETFDNWKKPTEAHLTLSTGLESKSVKNSIAPLLNKVARVDSGWTTGSSPVDPLPSKNKKTKEESSPVDHLPSKNKKSKEESSHKSKQKPKSTKALKLINELK